MNILACSGPGAGALIAKNISYADGQAYVVGLLFGVSLILCRIAGCRWYWPVGCGLFLLLHPAWTISAISGDCGDMKASMATAFTCLAGAIVVVQAIHGLHARRRDGRSHRA
jgi:hypothetical protein